MKEIVPHNGEDERLKQARHLLLQLLAVAAIVKTPVNRTKLRRRWRSYVPLLVPLAAAVLDEVPEAFPGLDFDGAALREDYRCQTVRGNIKAMLLHVVELVSDQLLAERAHVYDRLTAVCGGIESILENPAADPELRRRVAESSRTLRAALAGYNERMEKKGKRTLQARKAAPPLLGK